MEIARQHCFHYINLICLFTVGLLVLTRLVTSPSIFFICLSVTSLLVAINLTLISLNIILQLLKKGNTRQNVVQVAISTGFLSILVASILYSNVLTGIQPFIVQQYSMHPTLQPGDVVIADTWKHDEFRHGDIIFFRSVKTRQLTMVKRIIGLPSDQIRVTPDLAFNLTKPDFTKAQQRAYERAPDSGYQVNVGVNELFVLSDNHSHSKDSRLFGPVSQSSVTGVAQFVLFTVSADGPDFSRSGLSLVRQQ